MFCEACGSRMEGGAQVCPSCGTQVRDARLAETALNAKPAPASFSAPAPVVAAPAVGPPPDAACAAHPGVRATFICARCGTFCCAGCAAAVGGSAGLCYRCSESAGVIAPRGSRFVANLVDNFLILIPVGATFLIAALLGAMEKGKHSEDAVVGLIILAGVGGLFAGCAIQIAAQVNWGQSIGKRMMGIKVVRLNGQPIELWRLLVLRNLLVHVIAQLCGLVGLVDALMIFGDQQRCLHDYLADSIVVVAPKD